MNNNNEIILDLDHDKFVESYRHCTFNLKREFILSSDSNKNMIWIYSTQTKNNKWTCKRMYKIPEDFEIISVSKYSKLYLLSSNNRIYEWNLLTGKSTSMISCVEVNEVSYSFKIIKYIMHYN